MTRGRIYLIDDNNLPYESIEEGLANAVYHKAYDEREPIEVRVEKEPDHLFRNLKQMKHMITLLPDYLSGKGSMIIKMKAWKMKLPRKQEIRY